MFSLQHLDISSIVSVYLGLKSTFKFICSFFFSPFIVRIHARGESSHFVSEMLVHFVSNISLCY